MLKRSVAIRQIPSPSDQLQINFACLASPLVAIRQIPSPSNQQLLAGTLLFNLDWLNFPDFLAIPE